MQKYLSSKTLTEYLLALLFLLPFLFLNVRNSFHWGDDFAVYVNQAINIAKGNNVYSTTYEFIPGFSSLAPSAPAGFSLLLAPVYYLFGFNPYIFSVFMSLLFVFWAMLAFYFFRKQFGLTTSFIILIFAFYPNFMLWLKLLIASDILFSIFFLLAVLMLERQTTKRLNFLFAGVFAGLAIATRNIGWLLIPSVCLFFFFKRSRVGQAGDNNSSRFSGILIFTSVLLGIAWAFNYVLFKSPINYVSDAANLFSWDFLLTTFKFNLWYYTDNYLSLYKSTDPSLKIFSIIFSGFVLLFTITGSIVKIFRGTSITDFICLSYLVFILFFPVTSDYRYLAPVHVFIVWYFFYGLKFFSGKLPANLLSVSKAAFLILLLLIFRDHLQYLWVHGKETLPGPYEKTAQETFHYLKSNVSDSTIIVFNKPRALALYTGTRTTMHNVDAKPEENYRHLHSMGARYYLFNPMIYDLSYKELIDYKKERFKTIYVNGHYYLYEDTIALKTL